MNIQYETKSNKIENTAQARNEIKQWNCYWKNIAGGLGCF